MKGLVIFLCIVSACLAFTIFMAKREIRQAIAEYNGGIHRECGGTWELYSATYIKNHGTMYHYKCLKCGGKFASNYSGLKPNSHKEN